MSRGIQIRTGLSAGLPQITADRVQLQQVILNLVMNGMDALVDKADRKEIVISTRKNSDSDIVISVEDSGVGFTAESVEKLFEPFFTTKPHGIGLGLSISRSIAEAHAGRLWAEPRASGGAVFHLSIPIQQQVVDV